MTLADMLNLSTLTPLSRSVVYSILSASPLSQLIPFEDVGDISVLVMEARGVPQPNYRPINPASVTVAHARFNQRPETLKIMANRIQVDRQLRNNRSSYVDPKAAAIEQYSRAVAYEMVRAMFRGDPSILPDEPAGLEYRFLTDTRISDGSATPGTQLQVIDANAQNRGATDADRNAFMHDLHALLSLIDGGDADVLATNRQGRLYLGAAARQTRQMDTTKDMFGRMVDVFAGARVVDVGYTPSGVADRTQVLPSGTTQNDLVTDSIFAIKFGPQMFTGIQKGALETKELPTESDWPLETVAFEWVFGFALVNPFSVALLRRAF
ncbi:MAG: hypothetical protein QW838_04220 [Candidatus Nitrosotenuis sp.]